MQRVVNVHPAYVEISEAAQLPVSEHFFTQVAELHVERTVLESRGDGFGHKPENVLPVNAINVVLSFADDSCVYI